MDLYYLTGVGMNRNKLAAMNSCCVNSIVVFRYSLLRPM